MRRRCATAYSFPRLTGPQSPAFLRAPPQTTGFQRAPVLRRLSERLSSIQRLEAPVVLDATSEFLVSKPARQPVWARLANELPLGSLKHGREEGVGPSRQPVQVEFRHWEILAIICDKSAGLLDGNCGYDDVRQSDCFAFFGPKVFKSSCVLPRTRVERKAFPSSEQHSKDSRNVIVLRSSSGRISE